ncbi:uncharacterized protein LOC112269257 [Brachypodium distachyon]|uniref:uncharacterized protein LOC112269257 n=1 Tax=Brachypodium distachyon TaxID=15368 RepID=UPI000D0DE75B|nr:uncharacterized protein LOC112269257 [Brachypodium distachyon]XP_024311294.1 uncharacterized protein LOC112269257 [Brachypodium distachyon]XP_024311295.1 uncharacterized protein LOC112269257 [Brachypodium distachyon]XP_024311296.1 uncharacterized protein LOC112269257 [Brachypodium distachyon]|eukprot:XP_024311293.1 uncharacterized protein LOC112269257 [Brachypodium distachyon]
MSYMMMLRVALCLVLSVQVMCYFTCFSDFFRICVFSFCALLAHICFLVCGAALYTVEFQKRGLPHAHMLVWLEGGQRFSVEYVSDLPPSAIDAVISAELPDVFLDPLLYALVDEFMVHWPCGRMNARCPCMKDGVCSKRYPKSFHSSTVVDNDGYVTYRRREDNPFVMKCVHRLDNRWVVPYNAWLLRKLHAHINVEWCNKTHLVKYLFKYVHKGLDRAKAKVFVPSGSGDGESSLHLSSMPSRDLPCVDGAAEAVMVASLSDASLVVVKGVDEVEEYLSCRYLSSCEAIWRLFAFDLHVWFPSVERL